jgi:hypothetical protein
VASSSFEEELFYAEDPKGTAGPRPHISTYAEETLRHARRAGRLRPLEERVGMPFEEILDSLLPEISRVMPRGAEANLNGQDFADEVMIAWGRVAESRLGQALVLEDEMRAMSWRRRRHKRQAIVNAFIEYTMDDSRRTRGKGG